MIKVVDILQVPFMSFWEQVIEKLGLWGGAAGRLREEQLGRSSVGIC